MTYLVVDDFVHDTMPPAKSWTGILIPINVFIFLVKNEFLRHAVYHTTKGCIL